MFESLQLNDLIFQAPEKLQGYSNVALNATFQLSGTFKRKFLANQAWPFYLAFFMAFYLQFSIDLYGLPSILFNPTRVLGLS